MTPEPTNGCEGGRMEELFAGRIYALLKYSLLCPMSCGGKTDENCVTAATTTYCKVRIVYVGTNNIKENVPSNKRMKGPSLP